MEYSINSRYLNAEILNDGETAYCKSRKPLSFSSKDAHYHTFSAGDTLEGIAYTYYGNESLYWVVLDANPKYMSELDIQVGDILIIPQYSTASGVII